MIREAKTENGWVRGIEAADPSIYDMCKAIDKHMVISDVHLVEKTGGKSGDFRFEESI